MGVIIIFIFLKDDIHRKLTMYSTEKLQNLPDQDHEACTANKE